MADTPTSNGGFESAGVTLAVVDKFSATSALYVDDMRKIAAASNGLAASESKIASAMRVSEDAWAKNARAQKISGEQASKYALAAGVLSGQMRQLGIQNEVAARGIGVVTEALMGGLNPIAATVLALGTLATAIVAIVTHLSQMKKKSEEAQRALLGIVSGSAELSRAEREVLELRRRRLEVDLSEQSIILTQIQLKHQQTAAEMLFQQVLLRLAPALGEVARKKREDEAAQYEKKLSEQALKVAELRVELEKLGGALAGKAFGPEWDEAAWQRYQSALREIEQQHKAIAAAGVEADKELDRSLQRMIEREERKIAERVKQMNRLEQLEEQARQASLEADQRAEDAAAEIRRRAAEQRQSDFMNWVQTATSAAQAVGAAIGATAAGATNAWRQAAIAMIQIAAHAAARQLAIWGMARAALGDPWGAAKAAAGIVAVEGAAAAAVAYMQQQQQRQARVATAGASGSGGMATGPSIRVVGGAAAANNVVYAQPNFTMNLTVNGGSPESMRATRLEAQGWLDDHFPAWWKRQALLGAR